MRIFIAVRHANDAKRFYGGLWSGNFYPALRALGHELVESSTDLAPTSRFMDVAGDFTAQEIEARAQTTERILDELEAAHRQRPIDLFLSYFYNAHFEASGFDRIRALGIKSINFYCNSIYQFANVAEIAARVDTSWHAERDARASYLRVGANPVWVQMAADPAMYHPLGAERQPVACFVGQNYADRAQWVAALIAAGVPIEVYGQGWGGADPAPAESSAVQEIEYLGRPQPRPGSVGAYSQMIRDIVVKDGLVTGARRLANRLADRRGKRDHSALLAPHAHGPIPFDTLLDVFDRSEVCLNFSNVWADAPGSRLIPHVRLRDFEGPMCRTCYLTGHTDEIAAFYDIGREIDTYHTPEELIDKTRFYLANPDAAERLRDAGYRRARGNHTWQHRFTQLFQQTGLVRH